MPTTVLRGGHVLDLTDGTWRAADVMVDDGTITAVGADLIGTGADELDVAGRFVMPGLIDGHVHVTAFSADLRDLELAASSYGHAHSARIMREMLRRGFTTVRDMGGADHGLARAQAEGLLPGPRLFYCGHALSQTGGHGDMRPPGDDGPARTAPGPGISRVADGVDGVRRAAREELRKGADQIKIMASGGVASPTDRIDSTQYSIAEITAAVEEAAAANRYVGAHAYTARAVNRALRAGVRSIEHGNLLDAASLALLREHDAFLVPTLVTYWALQRAGREHGLSETGWAKVDSVLDRGLDALRQAHGAGVAIVYGSDLLGGMHTYQNEEFRLRAQVQPVLDVVRSATTTAAALLGRSGVLGVVAPGAVADLLVLDADPLADVDVLADIGEHLERVIRPARSCTAGGSSPRPLVRGDTRSPGATGVPPPTRGRHGSGRRGTGPAQAWAGVRKRVGLRRRAELRQWVELRPRPPLRSRDRRRDGPPRPGAATAPGRG